MNATNPIQKRLQKLQQIWSEFADDPNARLLRWLADADTVRMIDVFVDVENDEQAGVTSALFVEFRCHFSDADEYANELSRSLRQQYEDVQGSLSDNGIADDWAPTESDNSSPQEFLDLLKSFQQHYADTVPMIVATLIPEQASAGPDAWRSWLDKLLQCELSSEVRVMLLDDVDSPVLCELAEKHGDKVVTVDPELDMPGAYEEIAEEAPGSGPGHDFRKLYVALTNAGGSGDIDRAKTLGERATTLAVEHKWHHLAAVAQMSLGAAHFGVGQIEEAIFCYQSANASAVKAEDDTVGPKLNVQTRMAEGAALIAAERFEEAAEVYATTAPLAQKIEDLSAQLECSRMAGWCFENENKPEEAWQWGEKSVAVGTLLDESDRQTSTLPWAGQMLIRLAGQGTHSDRRDEIEQQMESLLGPEWEPDKEGVAS